MSKNNTTVTHIQVSNDPTDGVICGADLHGAFSAYVDSPTEVCDVCSSYGCPVINVRMGNNLRILRQV